MPYNTIFLPFDLEYASPVSVTVTHQTLVSMKSYVAGCNGMFCF